MKLWKLLPLFLLATACSKSQEPDRNLSQGDFAATNDAGFNQALQDYVGARDALRAKRCDEKSCFVPHYPKSKPLLEEIQAAAAKAEAVVNYPIPAEIGARERSRAHDWRTGMLAHAAKIDASVKDTEAKLGALEPQLVPLRENLQKLTARAAADGCSLPAEGKVISCTGVAPPLESVEEARGLMREIDHAAAFSQAFKDLQAAYATVPNLESDELLLARKKSADLDRYLVLIRPTFGTLLREMVKARWYKVAEAFKAKGIDAAYPRSLDDSFAGEPSEAMLRQAQAGLDSASTFAGFAQNADQFTGRAIDRIEVVSEASSAYGPEAFQYHPANPKSLTVKINADTGFFGLNWLLLGIASKTDARYVERQSLIEVWKKARANPPRQEDGGTIVPISIHVDDDFLDGLILKLPLKSAIETMNSLVAARATLNTKLDTALRGGRALRGNERIVICDYSSCGRSVPGTFMLELNDRNPELTDARLDLVVQKLAKGL